MLRRSKRRDEEHDNQERWLVSYADFITLLFAFFTVLYATSNQDLTKQKEFESSVRKAFLLIAQMGKGSGPGDYANPDENSSPIPPPIELFRKPYAGNAELANALERMVDEKISKEEKAGLKLEIREDAFGIRLSLDSTAMFDSGSTVMKKEGLNVFNKLAEILKETEKGLIVEGHTDSLPISTALYPSNWELAAARASTIVRYLIKVHKVEAAKLTAVSLADQRPIAANDTEEGRKKNRRIEILLTTKPTGID